MYFIKTNTVHLGAKPLRKVMIIRSLYIVPSINFKALNFVIFFNCINIVRAVLMVSQVRGGGEANRRL